MRCRGRSVNLSNSDTFEKTRQFSILEKAKFVSGFTHTTINTAVKMDANPIQVKIASLPRVRILAMRAVQIAATKVHTIVQALPLARIFSPCARPMNPEPVANLLMVSKRLNPCHGGKDVHPSQQEQSTRNLSRYRASYD